jgi:hypothetical protein
MVLFYNIRHWAKLFLRPLSPAYITKWLQVIAAKGEKAVIPKSCG